MMDETIEKAIKEIIAVCDESIESDRLGEYFPREPIGRSDTFMIRNTLQSILDIWKTWPCDKKLTPSPPQGVRQ